MSNPAKRGHAPPSGDTPGKNRSQKTATAHQARLRGNLVPFRIKAAGWNF